MKGQLATNKSTVNLNNGQLRNGLSSAAAFKKHRDLLSSGGGMSTYAKSELGYVNRDAKEPPFLVLPHSEDLDKYMTK